MYYVIEKSYQGPNRCDDKNIDADTIVISSLPARRNGDHTVCTQGWCGGTNDWSTHAHGEYITLGDARKAIEEIWGETREQDDALKDEGELEVYKPGKYAPITSETLGEILHNLKQDEIYPNSTNDELEEIAEDCEDNAREHGCTYDGGLFEELLDIRDQLVEEQGEEDEDEEEE